MINSTADADLLLHDADFPENYSEMQHPEDYKVVQEPFVECIPHFSSRHNRLIARVCWEVQGNEYLPMSFVCDTGAPMGLYLSEKALSKLKACGRVMEDETGTKYAAIRGVGKVAIDYTPPVSKANRDFVPGHTPANIMGLRVLVKLEIRLKGDNTFCFGNMPAAL